MVNDLISNAAKLLPVRQATYNSLGAEGGGATKFLQIYT